MPTSNPGVLSTAEADAPFERRHHAERPPRAVPAGARNLSPVERLVLNLPRRPSAGVRARRGHVS